MAWDSNDTALTIKGVGTLANAYGQYKTNTERNKIARQELDYMKAQDAKGEARLADAQTELDNAWDEDVFGTKKKKQKHYDGTLVLNDDTIDSAMA